VGLFQQGSESLGPIKVMELTNCETIGFSSRALLYGTDVTDKHNEILKWYVKENPDVYRINIRNKEEISYGTLENGANDPNIERCSVKNHAKTV